MNETVVPPRTYALVALALLVLLGLTAAVAEIDLGPLNALAALLIAVVKAILVVLFFMEVRYRSRLTWLFAAAGFLWLGIMIGLTLADTLHRSRAVFPLG